MPRYEFVCGKCGHREDVVCSIAERDNARICPACSKVPVRLGDPGDRVMADHSPGIMSRDVLASMRPHTDLGYWSPMYSNAAGINPEQIPEAKRAFPHHEYTADGRMVFRSHRERERALKDIGMIDLKG